MTSKLPRLILHFDVNGTIIITDPAGGLSFEDALHKAIRQVDWDESTTWPPCPRNKKALATVDDMLKALAWPEDVAVNPELCQDGKHHFLFPSFLNAITVLAKEKREFTIVFRTFGSDMEKVQAAINSYAMGKHPQYSYKGNEELHLPTSRSWIGRYGGGRFPPDGNESIPFASLGSINYTLRNVEDGTKVLKSDDEIITAFECNQEPRSSVACVDHYEWWRDHKYIPSSGKPMWLTEDDRKTHHIFFDDCIHKSASDSIVSARRRKTANDSFIMLPGESTVALHGCHTVRVKTTEAVVNHNYFLDKIKECELARKNSQI